jgi:hypothetical protein
VSATASGDYQFLPTQIKDRNGNFLTIVYKQLNNNDTVLDYVLDPLGRRKTACGWCRTRTITTPTARLSIAARR